MSDTLQRPDTERKPREAKRGGLFVTDAELLERLGIPEKIGYEALHMLDKDPRKGFPAKDPFWGGRRYWPAVRKFLDDTQAPRLSASANRGRAQND